MSFAKNSISNGGTVEKKVQKVKMLGVNIVFLTLFHILALYGLLFGWKFTKPVTFLYSYIVSLISGFGVTGGAHRYWTHRTYKAKRPLEILLAICYTSAGMNPIPAWVLDHRVHHKYTDTELDPHNANRGFFYSHIGWLFYEKSREVKEMGKKLDISDVVNDPIVKFFTKYFLPLKLVIAYLIPTIIPVYFWNESWKGAIFVALFLRCVYVLNCTWMVNSVAHIWGHKPYDRRIAPRESTITSLLSMGEGWHNYHHVFPWDYKASEYPYKLNLTTILLDFFQFIGWAYDCKQPSKEMVQRVIERYGDGSHSHFEVLPPGETCKEEKPLPGSIPQYVVQEAFRM